MNDAGRVGFVPKGSYSSTTQYEILDTVFANRLSYVARKTTTGNPPSPAGEVTEFWQPINATGGGHTIKDYTGASETASREYLQFANGTVTDDASNQWTVVTWVITPTEWTQIETILA